MTALHSLAELTDGLERTPAEPALIGHRQGGTEVWTRGELGARARALAAGLRHAGLEGEEVVGLLAPNRPQWVLAFLGIVRAGAVAMPINEQIAAAELERIVAHSGCRRIFTTRAFVRTLASLARPEGSAPLELLLLDDRPAEDPPQDQEALDAAPLRSWRQLAADAPADLPAVEPSRRAVLAYTSGTTGTPKGVPLSHANLIANIQALLRERLAGPEDRVLLPLPLHHAYPLTVGLLTGLAAGATVVLPSGISGPEIARALTESRCTIMVAVPRLYEAMLTGIERRVAGQRLLRRAVARLLELSIALRRRFGWRLGRRLFWPLHRRLGPELRLLASGGARLEPEIAWRLEGLGWQVLTGYGLTETAPILTFNPPGRARLETAGLPVEGVELRIAAPAPQAAEGAGGDQAVEPAPAAARSAGSDRAAPEPATEAAVAAPATAASPDSEAPGRAPEQGEIQARGPNVFEGYWHNPEATAEAFTADGFFRTGDLGHLDDDGYLHIGGRSKELIVLAGGKNVFPEEVEAVYGESGLIQELAVLERDGRLVGLIVPATDALRTTGEDELQRLLRTEIEQRSRQLASYQRLGDFAITPEALPRTQIGKLRRHLLDEMFERAKAGAAAPERQPELSARDRALLDSAELAAVWQWLEERFAPKPLTLDTSPQLDLGLDSFDWMSLTMELGERFGVQLSEDALGRVTTLRDLLVEIEQAEPESAAIGEIGEPTAEQRRWFAPQGPAVRLLAAVLLGLNRALVYGLFRLRVEGAEHLPADGPYLLAPNHASYLDPFAVGAALSWSQLQHLYWAGWTGLLFRGPLTRLFSRAARVLPVDPERGLTSTLPLAIAALERGNALCWFPEGARSTDGRMHRFLPGVGLLLERTGVPAVPVFVGGSFEAWPPRRSLPRLRPLLVRFGRPLSFEAVAAGEPRGGAAAAERHREIADRLHDAVAALAEGAPRPPA